MICNREQIGCCLPSGTCSVILMLKHQKMNTAKILLFTGIICILFNPGGYAQEVPPASESPDSVLKVTMMDGSVFVGVFVSETSQTISLKTKYLGVIDLSRNNILQIDGLGSEALKKSKAWFENPNSTRYLFGPSAIPIGKGEGYYQNVYVVLQSFNYGLTKNISIGAGFDVITPFVRDVPPFFFITPKASFKVAEKIHLGAGLLYANTAAFEISGLGIGYGIFTYGTAENNITAGLGWGFIEGETTDGPIITLSGMARITRRLGLVSENWVVPVDGYYGVFSYGLRFMSEKITVDFAFINNPDIFSEIFIGIPYVDFVIKFGKYD